MTVSALKSRLHRAQVLLRKHMDEFLKAHTRLASQVEYQHLDVHDLDADVLGQFDYLNHQNKRVFEGILKIFDTPPFKTSKNR